MSSQRNQLIDRDSSRIRFFRQYNTYSQGKVRLRITGERFSHQTYLPAERRLETTKCTEQRRFAGTVQSQQTGHFAGDELQVQIVMDNFPLAAFQQVTDAEPYCFYCSYFCHTPISQSIGYSSDSQSHK